MEAAIILSVISAAIILLLLLPIRGAGNIRPTRPHGRFDEACAVLSRRLLVPGTGAYDAYYAEHPEFRERDDRSRNAPGLLSEKARNYHPGTFAASKANFHVIEKLREMTLVRHLPGEPPPLRKTSTDPEGMTRFICEWLRKSGAHSAGITPLKDYHLYSHKGRGPRKGERIQKIHDNAIAITVEMDHRMMRSAPLGSSVMESSEQYLGSGILALKLAAFIRELGYPATAHIDGEYEVICPLVAADAGLGVIGRMGLLMTPRRGPRVRISVVTTGMPLAPGSTEGRSAGRERSIATSTLFERTTLHFCQLCRKCAVNCPAGAIPEGPGKLIGGVERWQIDSERCYHYWTTSGTDCGRCIAVCPFSHSGGPVHRFTRWGIKNNLFFRYLAIKFDDVFYGRKPSISPLPGWTDIMKRP